MDSGPPGFSVHGILQARILKWVAISFSRGSSQPRDWTWVSCITGRCFNLWATTEAIPSYPSVQFSHSVVSDSWRPHESQHARPPCPLPNPRVYSHSCPWSRWCHSSHLILCWSLLHLPPVPPSIRVFSNESTLCIRLPKYWSFSFSISPSDEHPGLISFRMDWLDLLQSKGLSRVFSNTTVQKHQFFGSQLSSQSNSHMHTWPLEKP